MWFKLGPILVDVEFTPVAAPSRAAVSVISESVQAKVILPHPCQVELRDVGPRTYVTIVAADEARSPCEQLIELAAHGRVRSFAAGKELIHDCVITIFEGGSEVSAEGEANQLGRLRISLILDADRVAFKQLVVSAWVTSSGLVWSAFQSADELDERDGSQNWNVNWTK